MCVFCVDEYYLLWLRKTGSRSSLKVLIAVPVIATFIASQMLEMVTVPLLFEFFLLQKINKFLQKIPVQMFFVSFLL
jgi:hypothetical protein